MTDLNIFESTKIAAVHRHLIWEQRLITATELMHVYGQGRYGRTFTLKRAAARGVIILGELPFTFKNGKTVIKPAYRWALGTRGEYLRGLSDERLENAFTYCENKMLDSVGLKPVVTMTPPEQWGRWVADIKDEQVRRGT